MNTQIKFMYLGDHVGGGSYFGMCFACGKQFMSTAERIAVKNGLTKFCLKCEAAGKAK
jgi:hypothetical protein